MMGADIGASRSDLRGIFEESRKAAGMSHTAQEDLRKFLDTHPGMGDATTQAWVRRFSKSGRLHLTPALTGSLGAPVNKTGQTYVVFECCCITRSWNITRNKYQSSVFTTFFVTFSIYILEHTCGRLRHRPTHDRHDTLEQQVRSIGSYFDDAVQEEE